MTGRVYDDIEGHIPIYKREPYHRGLNDIGDTYIEIDMTDQKMYFYLEGECLVDTKIVTGNTGRRMGPPEGVNYVYAMQRNRTLRGADYAAFVNFWMPVKGNIGIHDKEGLFHLGSNVGKIELYNEKEILLEEYVVSYMKSTYGYKELTKHIKATAQASISIEAIRDVYIAIPPSNEQIRISKQIKEILSLIENIDKAHVDIDNLKSLIKSKILELAIQGKLVEQNENDEPASVLLERIRAEKKAQLGKKYVESYIYKGDDNCYYEKVGSVIKNITEFIPFEIPASWRFIRLKELIKLISGVSYDKCDICADGIRILRGGNIGNLTIQIQQDDVFLPAKYFDEEKQVRIGDVIIVASTGSKVAIGRAGFIEKEYLGTQIGAFLRIVRPIDIAFANYIKCIFSTDYYREHIRDMVHGNTINNIKSD